MAIVFSILELFIFIPMLIWIGYIFVYAVGYRLPNRISYAASRTINRYLVLFPAYKEDSVILESVQQFLKQDYPKSAYQVVVIADDFKERTLEALRQLEVTVLLPDYSKRSKAAAIKMAMSQLATNAYEGVVIMDADNHVDANFLSQVNVVFDAGQQVIQTHRVAKNQHTDTAYLDGLSEEINNSIFRQGHNNLGLPAALSGSGMIFEREWFARTIAKIDAMGEDKELEYYLLKDQLYTTYLGAVFVYDEKVAKRIDMSNQRKRWIAAQVDVFLKLIKEFPAIVRARNWSMLDKLIQWSMPPRILILAWGPLWMLLLSFTAPERICKWALLYFIFVTALLLALPNRYYTRRTVAVIFKLPLIFIAILRSFIGLGSARTTFIHTPHGQAEEDHNHRSPTDIP